jgi:phage shock protein B
MVVVNLLFVVVILLLASIVMCIMGLAAGASRMMKGRPRESDTDEARVIQEIHQGLIRMEERLEALETIIMEREEDRSAY